VDKDQVAVGAGPPAPGVGRAACALRHRAGLVRLRRRTDLAWNSMAAELSPGGKRYHISASANYV
jgi:hypothetical protein